MKKQVPGLQLQGTEMDERGVNIYNNEGIGAPQFEDMAMK